MLKQINLKQLMENEQDLFLKCLLEAVDSNITEIGSEVMPGIYLAGTNSEHFFKDQIIEEYNSFSDTDEYRSNYGVCDNQEQILNRYPELQASNDRNFVVLMTPIRKEDQPEEWGWRWHKWGPYIGTQEPTREYLYDEPNIDLVYVYHIYEVV